MGRSTALLILLALLIGFVLFKVKYEVVETEEKLLQTLAQIRKEEENIHILKAEWSHLNEPQRLQKLAHKYLDIGPIKAEQVVAIVKDAENELSYKYTIPHARFASMKEVK